MFRNSNEVVKLKFLKRVFYYQKSLSYPQLDVVSDPKLIRYFAGKEKGLKSGNGASRIYHGYSIISMFELKVHTVRLI